MTNAAVQPTGMRDRQSGELLHCSAGQIIITANWQIVDGALYFEPKNPSDITNKNVESHQQIWNVLVDVEKGEVLQVAQQADRVVTDTAGSDLVCANVNMGIPKTILVEAGSEVRWSNPSKLPDNVVGVFNQTAGSDRTESTTIIPENSSASNSNKTNTKSAEGIAIDGIDTGYWT